MIEKPQSKLLSRLVNLTRAELAQISNEGTYLLPADAEVPHYLGLSHEGRLLGYSLIEKAEVQADGSILLSLEKKRDSQTPYLIDNESFLRREAKIKEDRLALEIRTLEVAGEANQRKQTWESENQPRDSKPQIPQEYITEAALWAESIASYLSNHLTSPKAVALSDMTTQVCQRIAEKAKQGEYRGEDDRELSDLIYLLAFFCDDDYESYVNVLALKEKVSLWSGELNLSGEEDIKPILAQKA